MDSVFQCYQVSIVFLPSFSRPLRDDIHLGVQLRQYRKIPSAVVSGKISSFEKITAISFFNDRKRLSYPASERRFGAIAIQPPLTQENPTMPKFTEHDIRTLAYKFWQERGCPSNNLPEEDWKKAEWILMSETDEQEIAQSDAPAPVYPSADDTNNS